MEKSPLAAGKIAPGGRVQGFLGLLQVRWAEMAAAQRAWVVLGLLMTLGLVGGLIWYAMRTDWRTLYAASRCRRRAADGRGAHAGADSV